MESNRFDAIVRTLARPASRRRTLAGVIATALAPLAEAAAEPQPAKCLPNGKRCRQPASDAADHGKAKRGGKGNHHPPSCTKCCSRLGTPDANGKARCTCKSEGIACDAPSQCCSGDCRNGNCTACPPNTVFCGDGCANLQTDKQHCGSCDKACDTGQRCQAGTCVCDAQSCPTGCCDQDATCQRGTSDGACGDGGATCQICTPTCQVCDGSTCVAVNLGQSCTPVDGGTNDAVCQADGRCCVPSGGTCGGAGCSADNCCNGGCNCPICA